MLSSWLARLVYLTMLKVEALDAEFAQPAQVVKIDGFFGFGPSHNEELEDEEDVD